MAVFHYVTRSVQEYAEKMKRGSGHSQYARLSKRLNITSRGWNYFIMINDISTGECLEGLQAYKQCCEARVCTCTPDYDEVEIRERAAVVADA